MGNIIQSIFPKVTRPEDCQTSEEAQRIADRLMSEGNSRFNDADGEFGIGSSFSAANAFNEASKYQARAEELRRQGK